MDFNQFRKAIEDRKFPITFPGNWIHRKWQHLPAAKPMRGSFNPSRNELLVEPSSDRVVLLAALDSAQEGAEKLAKLTFKERLGLIKKMRQVLADFQSTSIAAMCIESGKPYWEAQADFDAAMRYLDGVLKNGESIEANLLSAAKLNAKAHDFFMNPVGITLAVIPFSTPITSFVTYFTGAMLAGCPLILCPSTHAVLSGLLYAYLDETLELPAGNLNLVFGNFDTFKKVLSDKRIQAIIYTGSREHCELIRRESKAVEGRQLILQSGGKNSVLVHSSADVKTAVKCVVTGAFKSSGQLCTSTSRVFVHKSLLKNFNQQLLETMSQVVVGVTDQFENEKNTPSMGPLYSEKAVEKFLRYQTMAHREASESLLWGKTVAGVKNANLVSPGIHLMKAFDNTSGYQSNVLFCPDLAIYEYEVLDEAVKMINTTDAPFVVSYCGDPEIIKSRRHQFVAPNMLINLPTVEVESSPVVAGKFKSGHHRYGGVGLVHLLTYPNITLTERDVVAPFPAWLD
jgi:acyl-CoA reductase-like NAD-dependent aldehyde dehydrogenase